MYSGSIVLKNGEWWKTTKSKKKKNVVIKSAEWYVVQCSEENKNSAVKKI